LPSFDLLRYRRHDARVFLYAFDLIELNGEDRRRDPLDRRKADLVRLLTSAAPGLRLDEDRAIDGATLRARLQARPRRHRLETQRLALAVRPLRRLGQVEESG
jgi:ATP-dependent DNA ligase